MKRWWKRLAVAAAWLGLGTAAVHAQAFTAGPNGAARMPEPLRYNPGPPPNLVPGPLTPQIAPAGPPPELSLPASHSNAYPLENYSIEAGFYASLGGMGLRRVQHEAGINVLSDPNNDLDTGNLSSRNLPVVGNSRDVVPNMQYGGRATLGYLLGNTAFELNGFYVPQAESSKTLVSPGRLTVPFFSSNGGFPLGFQGNNGIFTQADVVKLAFRSELASGEALYRTWNGGVNGIDTLIGVRYLYVKERAAVFSNDDGLILNDLNQSDPLRAATYATQVQTHFYGLTFGGEWSGQLWQDRVWLTGIGKLAAGVNHIQRQVSLVRGDGFVGFDESRERIQVGGLADATIALDIHLLEKARLRLGYQLLYLFGTTSPNAQFNPDLSQPNQLGFGYRDVFYHGPQIELQMLF